MSIDGIQNLCQIFLGLLFILRFKKLIESWDSHVVGPNFPILKTNEINILRIQIYHYGGFPYIHTYIHTYPNFLWSFIQAQHNYTKSNLMWVGNGYCVVVLNNSWKSILSFYYFCLFFWGNNILVFYRYFPKTGNFKANDITYNRGEQTSCCSFIGTGIEKKKNYQVFLLSYNSLARTNRLSSQSPSQEQLCQRQKKIKIANCCIINYTTNKQ